MPDTSDMTTSGLRLAVVDDHPAILYGVVESLRGLLDGEVTALVARHVGEIADDGDTPRIALLDVQLNDGSEPEDNVRLLRDRGWPVLLYTQEVRPRVVAGCLAAGAMGVVAKHEGLDRLAVAIRVVLRGEPYLSDTWAAALDSDAAWQGPHLSAREAEALRLYATGLPLKSVARRMEISVETAKEYLIRVRRKYTEVGRDAQTKTDLYIRAVEDGLLPPPDEPRIDPSTS